MADEPEPIRSAKPRKPGGGLPSTMAGIMAGLDQDAFRTTPPPHELVRKGETVKRTIAGDGGIEIVWPEDEDPADHESTSREPEAEPPP